jgi:hypothetical protein
MTIIYVIILTFIIYVVISIFFITKSHESCHKEIFEARGYKPIITMFSCTVSDEQIKKKDINDLNKLNDLADIIQYHMQTYWFILTFLVLIILCFVAYFIGV